LPPDPDQSLAAEDARLAALADYAILDTPPEPVFDGIVQLAASLCRSPMALISLVDRDRQWFKARAGLEACQTPIEQSVCAHALTRTDLLIIPDLTLDPRTRANPLVTSAPHMRFYAGAPLVTPAGVVIGTLCVIDTVARPDGLTDVQRQSLTALSHQVVALLEMRAMVVERGQHIAVGHQVNAAALARAITSEAAQAELRTRETRARLAQAAGGVGTFELDTATGRMSVSAEFCHLFGLPVAPEYPAAVMEALVLPEDHSIRSSTATRADGSAPAGAEYRIRRADNGALRWIARRSEFLRDAEGRPVAMFGTVQDVTSRKFATERLSALVQLGDALREATSRTAVLLAASAILGQTLAASRAGYGEIDLRSGTLTVARDWTVPGIASLAGQHRLEGFGSPLGHIVPEQALGREDVLQGLTTEEDVARYEAAQVRAKLDVPLLRRGELAAVLFVHSSTPRPWLPGEIEFAQGVAERTYAALARLQGDAQQQVLNHELSHRLKNTFAMVQAIATQTLRPVTPREPVQALQQRIHALSTAHDVLLQQNWTEASIHAVAEQVLGALGQINRFDLCGPDISLSPRSALSFAMLLHEMGTNAVKYGALSNEIGRVSLSWCISGEGAEAEMALRWRERGGPMVQVPEASSFGSKLIKMGLMGTGGVLLRYPLEGFEADMTALLEEVQSP
jgi:two-component sensor histidine kinase